MSDIFISYASADRPRVKPLVEALERQGWSVWWDRAIPPGKTWDQVIEAALSEARCVVVLWSRDSVQSDWVRTEADDARQRGILVPALLDDVPIPLAFRRIQAANLVNWSGASSNAEFEELARAIATVLSNAAAIAPEVAASAKAAASTPPTTSKKPQLQYREDFQKAGEEQAAIEAHRGAQSEGTIPRWAALAEPETGERPVSAAPIRSRRTLVLIGASVLVCVVGLAWYFSVGHGPAPQGSGASPASGQVSESPKNELPANSASASSNPGAPVAPDLAPRTSQKGLPATQNPVMPEAAANAALVPKNKSSAASPPVMSNAEAIAALTPKLPGQTHRNLQDGLTYVWIPEGKFMMGCGPFDFGCPNDAKPSHEVTITKGFWLGQTLVTQAAYERVMGANPSYFKGANLPVEQVTWNQALTYCGKIRGWLPTEAEWEYAARARTSGGSYGNADDIGWHKKNSGGRTHEVGQKQPNAYGLYDMLGNVDQWTADWFGPYAQGAQTDPLGPSAPQGTWKGRVVRGSWFNVDPTQGFNVWERFDDTPGSPANGIGFRCREMSAKEIVERM